MKKFKRVLKALGLTEEEEQMIHELVTISDNLIILEDEVMNDVIGGEYTKAKDIIFGEEYESKIIQMEYIAEQFHTSIQNRITKRIDRLTGVI